MERCHIMAVQPPIRADAPAILRDAFTEARTGSAGTGETPDFVVLPEMFGCPYGAKKFPVYAEPEGGPTWQTLADCAAEYGVWLIAGSVPERGEDGKIYNTSYVFDRRGNQTAKHRKMHLFDINIQNGQHFRESDTLSPGNSVTTFETEFGTMGLCICYDIRFPELFRLMADAGAKMVFVPAAFNMTTGPAHWELSFRTRALDNQMYVLGCAPARNPDGPYVSYGHTIFTDPWGRVVQELDEKPGILLAEADFSYEQQIRDQLPLLKHRRSDLYEVTEKSGVNPAE